MDKPNRAERRKNKFGGGRSSEHGGWPEVAPNPVFHAETPEEASTQAEAPTPAAKPDGADQAPAKKGSSPEEAAPD